MGVGCTHYMMHTFFLTCSAFSADGVATKHVCSLVTGLLFAPAGAKNAVWQRDKHVCMYVCMYVCIPVASYFKVKKKHSTYACQGYIAIATNQAASKHYHTKYFPQSSFFSYAFLPLNLYVGVQNIPLCRLAHL